MNIKNEGAKQKEIKSAKESISFPKSDAMPIFRANFPSKESKIAAIKIKLQPNSNDPFFYRGFKL